MADGSPLRAQHIHHTSATHGAQSFVGTNYGNIHYANSGDNSHNPVQNCKPFQNIPFPPDRDFVDRPEILKWIHRMCSGPGSRAALVGLGGVGKSQLAIRYAYDIRDATPHRFVFWVHASTKVRFKEAYEALADRLGLPGRHDQNVDVLQLVSTWLSNETNGQWTMIVDNADDIETFFSSEERRQGEPSADASASLAKYLPQSCNGSILITSRNKNAAARLAGGHNYIKEVPTMDESQCLQLLRNKLLPNKLQDTSSEDDAMNLLRALGYVPLAIAQAAAYINQGFRITIPGYLSEFRANDKKKESLLHQDTGDLRRDPSALNSVVTTWQMSFERIRQERPSVAELLSLMSFFNPQGIPERILKEFRRAAEGPDCKDKADAIFNEDLNTLQAYSLIAATAEPDTCEMHSLVQFCTQMWLSSFGGLEQWKLAFVELMAREFPNGEFENWSRCQQLLPHVEWLLNAELAADELLEASTRVLRRVAWYTFMRGNYKKAEITARKVVIARECVVGLDNVETLSSLDTLANILLNQRQCGEAEELHRRVLKRREEELGVRHLQTLRSVNNLAGVLRFQMHHREAEKLYRRAVEGFEEELGVRHPDTLGSVNNLAVVLGTKGQWGKAEELHRRALKGYEEQLGVHHPRTLASLNGLANVLQRQGKYGEAEELCRQALKWGEEELGLRHPKTLISMFNLVRMLFSQRRYDEAGELCWRALKGCEEKLGIRHPRTLRSLHNLAKINHAQMRYEDARELYQRAYDGFMQELGHQHPYTSNCLKNFLAMQQEEKQARLEQPKE